MSTIINSVESGDGPLALTLRRLDALDEWCSYAAAGVVPADDGWVAVEQLLTDGAVLACWFDTLVSGPALGHRDVAGAYLSGWLGSRLVGPAAATAVTEGRSWPLDPLALALHRHPDGWFDGLAVRHPDLWVLPGDTGAAHPDITVLPDAHELYTAVAKGAVTLMEPLFAQIRAWAPFGLAGMWGTVADALAAQVIERAGQEGRDTEAAWVEANRFVDALAAQLPALRTRPGLARVPWSGGVAHLVVRGSCCLAHMVAGCDPDPCGEAYCVSCPFRDDDDRHRRLLADLEATARATAAAAADGTTSENPP